MRLCTVGKIAALGLAARKTLAKQAFVNFWRAVLRSAHALRAATLHLNRSCNAQGLLLRTSASHASSTDSIASHCRSGAKGYWRATST